MSSSRVAFPSSSALIIQAPVTVLLIDAMFMMVEIVKGVRIVSLAKP